jgi:hypothetical protein
LKPRLGITSEAADAPVFAVTSLQKLDGD